VDDLVYDNSYNRELNLYRDCDANLVIQRSLLTPRCDSDEDWQRIFHSTFTIKDKVCNLIIDGGNCENMVSSEAVKKFQLKTKSHPKPCKLIWLHKDIEVIVDRRCLVLFSMSKRCFDNVWCDMMYMNTCHLLFSKL
jgi:hypothetical protein